MTNPTAPIDQAKYRQDYLPPLFLISKTDLAFNLHESKTVVTSKLSMTRNGKHNQELVLDAEVDLIIEVLIDDVALSAEEYSYDSGTLSLEVDKDKFVLTTKSVVNPESNLQLEGLYKSAGVFCTQCEAEGFRKITPYLDRPDVLSVFTVNININEDVYPHVLANGNLISKVRNSDGTTTFTWHDPFPKPSYLFALVAGDFDVLTDSFITKSGKEVALEFYVDKGNLHLSHHAMSSLKKSMKWDEERYNLEYDLDIYMVVAVDFFNMGAMENKGLNVFNSKYVLADENTATDQDYHGIESVIAHEYFHNWTGNRVTCRDWFQLSLKEGLTVFRDQQFSADMGNPTIERISHANVMRTMQFSEDAGPMAHPIRPDKVVEMNNFYTVTVYDKGAEVIRMLNTILSEEGFQKGIKLYFERHDGQAVTCDDFVDAMQDANATDLSNFRLWYSQKGTPVVQVSEKIHGERYSFSLIQNNPVEGSGALPLTMPVRFELLCQATGKSVLRDTVIFNESRQTFTFNLSAEQLNAGIDLVLFEDFSAPVKVKRELDLQAMSRIIVNASNEFCRWDMLQSLWQRVALEFSYNSQSSSTKGENKGTSQVAEVLLLKTLASIIEDKTLSNSVKAEMLAIPSFNSLAEAFDIIDVDAIISVRKEVSNLITRDNFDKIFGYINSLGEVENGYEQSKVAHRHLLGTLLGLIANKTGDAEQEAQVTDIITSRFAAAKNMSEKMACLHAAKIHDQTLLFTLLTEFYNEYKGQVLVFDKMLQLIGTLDSDAVYDAMEAWSAKSDFDRKNPNRIRSLYGSFIMRNPTIFHKVDGKGYEFLTHLLLEVDTTNPQLAARLVDPLLGFQRYDEQRSNLMKAQLKLLSQKDISKDLNEKVRAAIN